MRIAPQETRTYLVTAITAERRSLFQVTGTAELLQWTYSTIAAKGSFSCMHSSSCRSIFML